MTPTFIALLSAFCLATPVWGAGPSSKPWDYRTNGPKTWPDNFQDCKGSNQSPINIVESGLSLPKTTWSSLALSSSASVTTTLANNGKGLTASLASTDVVRLSGGPLKDVYQVAQFHLHFHSGNGSAGSEHTVGGTQVEAEMHIVTWNTRFDNFSYAVTQPQGLAVLGSMIKPSTTSRSSDLANFFSESAKLQYNGDSTTLPLTLQNILPTDFANNFYHYNGSLTTPTCGEVVMWLLSAQVIDIEQSLLEGLGEVYTGVNASSPGYQLSGNFRPPQPLNGRTVLLYKQAGASATGPALTLLFTSLLFALFNLF